MNGLENYLWGIVSNITELYPNVRRVRGLTVMDSGYMEEWF